MFQFSFKILVVMEDLKYLQWDSHSAHFRRLLQELIITNNFADVTLVCEGQRMFRAHRNILSAGSKVLKDIFLFEDKLKIGGQQQSVVHLRGIKQAEMKAILEYIYLGETTLPADETNNFLLAAKGLGLMDCTEKRIQRNNDHIFNSNETNHDDALPLETDFNSQRKELTENAEPASQCKDNQMNENEQSKTTTEKVDAPTTKPRQITIGFNEVINRSIVKEEFAEEIEKCPECEFESDDRIAFKTHIEFAHDGVNYYCHDCDFKTTVSNELDLHIDSEHNGQDGNENHQCAHCGKVLSSAKKLRKHELLIHLKKREKISCNQCTYQAYNRNTMYTHIQHVHNNVNYPCEICGKFYQSSESLKNHVMKIHDKSVVFECDQCDYKASCSGTLKFHITAKHDKAEFNCDLCDKKYSYSSRLKQHKRSVHEGTRFSCDSCNFEAAYKSDVRTHKKIVHEGIRKKCDECDYQSKHTRELRNHMEKQHQKKVSYKNGVYTESQTPNETKICVDEKQA